MDIYVILLCGSVIVLFTMYFLLDINYFIRSIFVIISAKYFRKKIKFLGTSEIYGMVLTTDADLLLTHMNNARALRECDFARYDHLQRTGMLRIIWTQNGGGVVSAQTCRYRRPLHMFMMYKVITKPAYYDTKNIYFEHKLVSLRDDIIRCIVYVKLTLNLDLDKIVEKHYPNTIKPPMPKDLEQYLDYIKTNSERLKSSKPKRKSSSATQNINEDASINTEQGHINKPLLQNSTKLAKDS